MATSCPHYSCGLIQPYSSDNSRLCCASELPCNSEKSSQQIDVSRIPAKPLYLTNKQIKTILTSRHLLVLAQLMLTLGIPYMLIYVQIISPVFMLLILPIGIALTSVFMFLLVAVIDDVSLLF